MGGVPQRLTATMRLRLTDGETVLCPPPPLARLSLLRCPPAPQARVLVPASLASSRSATLGSSTTLAPPLDRVLPGALLLPLVQAPALMGSMDSARQPAHLTQPQQPPPPQPPQPQRPLQQQPQPPVPLLPQLQPRRPPAAPRAPSPQSTATPASATPSGNTFAAPSPALAPRQPQPQPQQQPPQQPPQRLPQPAQWPPDLQSDSLVSSPSLMAAPPSQAVLSGCMVESTRASCGAAPRLPRRAPL